MINISRDKEVVQLKFDTGVGFYIPFEYKRHCEMDAELLMARMQAQLNERIEMIRREAYNRGWKDKASKKVRKSEWFSGNIKY